MARPRGQQMIRELTVLQLLECRYGRTLDELARETGVTTRTIRRDLEVLEAAGLPIVDHIEDETAEWPASPARRWRVLHWRKEAA